MQPLMLSSPAAHMGSHPIFGASQQIPGLNWWKNAS